MVMVNYGYYGWHHMWPIRVVLGHYNTSAVRTIAIWTLDITNAELISAGHGLQCVTQNCHIPGHKHNSGAWG